MKLNGGPYIVEEVKKMAEKPQPYWLIREPGKTHGIMTIQLDEAITDGKAIEVAREKLEKEYHLFAPEIEAVLVILEYHDGEPVVTELTAHSDS
jgi:hypothetical protein